MSDARSRARARPATPVRAARVAKPAKPFWDATREQRLVVQWCRSCEQPIHFPRDACPRCLGDDLEFRPASGHGHRLRGQRDAEAGQPADGRTRAVRRRAVDLDEGVRMMSNIVGTEPDAVEIGLPVQVTWEPLSDGRHLPLFEPVGPLTRPPAGRLTWPDRFPDGWQEAANVGMSVAFWASRQPDALAIAAPSGDRTFAELNANANRLARLLRGRGLREHDRVLLLCGNRAEFADTTQATLRTGLRVTTHQLAPHGRRGQRTSPTTVVPPRWSPRPTSARWRPKWPNGHLGSRPVWRSAVRSPGSRTTPSAIGAEDGSDLTDPVLGGAMLYTSGTTGRPKGVYRRRVDPAVKALNAIYGYRPGEDRHLCTGPLYHAAPLAFSLAVPLQCGVGVTLMPGWDVTECLRLLAADRITHTHMVPTMFHRLLAVPAEQRERARHVGAAVRDPWRRAVPGQREAGRC